MKSPWALHPLLFSAFPVLFLVAQNLDQLSLSQAWPSLRLVCGSSLLLFLLFALILRNAKKAGIIVSLFFLLFFSYSHVISLLSDGPLRLPGLDPHWIIFIVWCLIFLGVTALVVRTSRALDNATRVLNIIALTLISISVVSIGIHEFRAPATGEARERIQLVELPLARDIPASELPNIYYVILDAYGRADILADLYHYDNTEFLTYLREKGFYVAEQGRSNYAQTDQSLASSLNVGYLDNLAAAIGSDTSDRKPLQELIQDSAVVQFLKDHGYTIVALSSVYEAADLRTIDVYKGQRRTLNALELAVLISTPLPWLMYREIGASPYDPHRETILSTFDHLADAADLPGPHFLFAHILVPHPPFVFDRYGNEILPEGTYSIFDGESFLRNATREEYVRGYTEQLVFANSKLRILLDELLARSARPAIVILQADHGPGSLLYWHDCDNACLKERFSILNAYLLPGTGSAELYPDISPVNTFRLIFNQYLGADLDLLEDRSYFSLWERPYLYTDVTDAIR